MKIVICGSHSMDDRIEACKDQLDCWFGIGDTIDEIIYPINDPNVPLVDKMENYVNAIQDCDLVVVLPKHVTPEGNEHSIECGESTTYEIAMARAFKKQIIFWEVYR